MNRTHLKPIVWLGAALALVFVARGETWTIDRAVEVALENNPDLRAAEARLEGAEAMREEARSHALPQLSLKSSYTQTDSPMMAFGSILNQRAFTFDLDFNDPGTIDNLNATASVGVNLYAGGRVSAGRRAAEAGLNAAEFDAAAARHRLVAETVRSYLDIRKAREAVAAVEAGVKAYEAAVSNAQLRFEAGQVLKADLLSLEVTLAQTREQLVEARHYQSLAERGFVFVLGLPAAERSIEMPPSDPSLERIVEPQSLDYRSRPELQALRQREEAARQMRRVASGARRPSVTGFASYQYDHGWETGRDGDAWMAGVAVNYDVFNGGKSSARLRQAEAQLSELREYMRKADLGIGLEVERARLAVELAKDRVAVTELSLAQAGESAALSRARYEEGALLTSELIGVEGRLMEARMRRAAAVADRITAVAELRRAVGLSPVQENWEVENRSID